MLRLSWLLLMHARQCPPLEPGCPSLQRKAEHYPAERRRPLPPAGPLQGRPKARCPSFEYTSSAQSEGTEAFRCSPERRSTRCRAGPGARTTGITEASCATDAELGRARGAPGGHGASTNSLPASPFPARCAAAREQMREAEQQQYSCGLSHALAAGCCRLSTASTWAMPMQPALAPNLGWACQLLHAAEDVQMTGMRGTIDCASMQGWATAGATGAPGSSAAAGSTSKHGAAQRMPAAAASSSSAANMACAAAMAAASSGLTFQPAVGDREGPGRPVG